MNRREFLTLVLGAGASLALPRINLRAFPPDWRLRGFIRMAYHENPIGPHPAVFSALEEVVRKTKEGRGIQRYAEELEGELKKWILKYNGVEGILSEDNVVLGIGSAEILFQVADAFCGKDRFILSEWPTYRIILQRAGHKIQAEGGDPKDGIVKVPLEDTGPDFHAMKKALKDDRIKVVHFNVINNPIGTPIEKVNFDEFVEYVSVNRPDVVIVADDSDPEFLDPELKKDFPRCQDYVVRGKPVIHIQTFSHAFALTGLRVGYAIARKDIAEKLEGARIKMGLNIMGFKAAIVSLENAGEQIRKSYDNNLQGREFLYSELGKIGLEFRKSQGLYMLIDTGIDSTEVFLKLFAKKVLVRDAKEWEFKTSIRITPGTEDENKIFLRKLKETISELKKSPFFSTNEGKKAYDEARKVLRFSPQGFFEFC